MVKLSTRLKIVYDMIDNCGCIADIGCDHGYLSIAIAQGQKADRVIAMDVNRGPLDAAKANVTASGLSDVIELRLSDGMKKLSVGEAAGICICGMGGLLMKRIVDAGLDCAKEAKYLILEPQSEYLELRSYLYNEGFCFDLEDIVIEENKTYPIMKVHYEPNDEKREHLNGLQLKFGPRLLESKPELFIKYLDKQEAELSEIKGKLVEKMQENATNVPINARIEQLTSELELIKEARSW